MMRAFFANFAGTIIATTVIGIALIVFALYLVSRSVLEPNQVRETELTLDTARIYRDKFSIPHIIAKSEADAFFTLGYAHAQDRLWQMDIARRTGRGTLSEIMGNKYVETDQFMRYIGLAKISASILSNASPATRSVLHSYSQGVNFYLQMHKSALPFEFGALQYEPDPWTPQDCLVIMRLTALEMSPSFWTDIALGDIADNVGVAKALDLLPSYPVSAPSVTGDKPTGVPARPAPPPPTDSSRPQQHSSLPTGSRSMLASVYGMMSNVRANLGLEGTAIGSNCWAMKKTTQAGSGAVLACDPHLPLSLPARWYQAHITAPHWNVTGLTMPGVPLFFVGRNNTVAWGYSAMMLDDADFFIEKTDPKNQNYYFDAEGKRLKFRYERDTILVRNGEPLIYDIRYAKRSSVISDVHLLKNQRQALRMSSAPANNVFLGRYCLTYSWTGAARSDELLALYRINRAESWGEFIAGANVWNVPGVNFTYSDKRGNIGIAPSGAVPLRQKCNPNVPNPAWIPGYSWKGTLQPDDLPRIYNPARRFVASANNMTSHTFSTFISTLWEPPSRALRLEEVLTQYDDYDIRDAQFIQMDNTSPFARQVNEIAVRVLESKKQFLSADDRKILAAMKKWDGLMSPRAPEPAVSAVFTDELLRHTFADELGERMYREYVLVSSLPTRRLTELLADSTSAWFDDVTTQTKEDRNEIIYRSFVAALRRLRAQFPGKPFTEWQFGAIHQITLRHSFSDNPYIRPIVTQGPLPSGGSNTTLNCGEWRYTEPFAQVIGASMRFIADMEDSVAFSIVPGGVSGEPLSAHYSDQLQLWLNGGYVPMHITPSPQQGFMLFEKIVPAPKKPKEEK